MFKSFVTPQQVLAMENVTELMPELFVDRIITQEEVTHILDKCDAFWLHDGDPKKPHALLHAGGHSNGFINTRLVLSYSNLCQLFAVQALKVVREYYYDGPIDWPLGSTSAAADLSKDVANILGARHDVFSIEGKRQIWKGPQIPEGEIIGQFEELMTTAATTLAVREGLKAAHEYPLKYASFIFTLIHRPDPSSKLDEIEGVPVLYLAHYDISVVKPEDVAQGKCQLCKQGSEAITAKGADWERLKGRA